MPGASKKAARTSVASLAAPPFTPPTYLTDLTKVDASEFDPWSVSTATMQRAHALGAHAMHQAKNARDVVAKQSKIELGDGKETLHAIVSCVEAGLVAPAWLASAFLRLVDRVAAAEARSWDEVFGAPWRGVKIPDKQRELQLASAIVHAAEAKRGRGRPIGEALFAEVAVDLQLGVKGGSYCSKLYYRWRDKFPAARAMADVELESRNAKPAVRTHTKKKKAE